MMAGRIKFAIANAHSTRMLFQAESGRVAVITVRANMPTIVVETEWTATDYTKQDMDDADGIIQKYLGMKSTDSTIQAQVNDTAARKQFIKKLMEL